MENNGWIKLHRRLRLKGYYTQSEYVHLWVHLLLCANHSSKEYMTNGKIIIIKEGQLLTGRKQLSTGTGIPESTVEDILRLLEREAQIRQQKTNKYRLITIVNWKGHQNSDNTPTTRRQHADTNKNERMKEGDSAPGRAEVPIIIDLFKGVNPSYKQLFKRPPQRAAVERLLDQYGQEKLTEMVNFLPRSNASRYAPTITTPVQLEQKMGELVAWSQKQKDIKKTNVAFA